MKLIKHYYCGVLSCSMFFLKDNLYEIYHKFRCNKFSILLNFSITELDSIREINAFFESFGKIPYMYFKKNF